MLGHMTTKTATTCDGSVKSMCRQVVQFCVYDCQYSPLSCHVKACSLHAVLVIANTKGYLHNLVEEITGL